MQQDRSRITPLTELFCCLCEELCCLARSLAPLSNSIQKAQPLLGVEHKAFEEFKESCWRETRRLKLRLGSKGDKDRMSRLSESSLLGGWRTMKKRSGWC